ncbi:MAG TPA: SPOR domain-containing protein [Candidatus Binataceae bacterium]|nr:SPOR domain-containing protein [Candidatus Binataceae bacterium]
MRFEVRGGGMAAIVIAITILSGAVFVLGLLAGYDVGRQSQLDTAQVATSFPLQPAAASPAAAATPAVQPPANPAQEAVASREGSTEANDTKAVAPATSVKAGASATRGQESRRLASSAASTSPPSRAVIPPPPPEEDLAKAPPGPEGSEGAGSAESAREPAANPEVTEPRRTLAAVNPSARRKPFNIQIQAAMDISGADQMISRLRRLGYPSHLVPTEIDGQRWYKVEVGPYATEEEASGAEAELRQRYDATYGAASAGATSAQQPPARTNSAGSTGVGDNAEE